MDSIREPYCIKTKSINDDPQYVVGSKQSYFHADDNLEDEALRKLLNPQDIENTEENMDDTLLSGSDKPSKQKSEKLGKYLTLD